MANLRETDDLTETRWSELSYQLWSQQEKTQIDDGLPYPRFDVDERRKLIGLKANYQRASSFSSKKLLWDLEEL